MKRIEIKIRLNTAKNWVVTTCIESKTVIRTFNSFYQTEYYLKGIQDCFTLDEQINMEKKSDEN